MCGVFNAIGDALGGIGDFIGNTIEGIANTITHPFDNPLATLGLGIGAATGLGGLGSGLFGGAASGLGAATTAGGLESALGGASLFGPMAGTGTAIGSTTLGALGGGGLGLADLGALGASAAGLGGALGGTSGLFSSATDALSGLSGLGSLGETSTLGGYGGADLGTGGLASSASTGLGAGDSLGLGAGVGTDAAMTPGYSANAALFGPNAAVPESGALSGSTGLSIEGNQLGTMATPFTMPTPLQTALYRANDFLSPIGGLSGLKTAGTALNMGSKLFGAYQTYKQQQARQQAYQNQLSQIDQLYSPDSPYAQQMAKTLAARDAAAGRRSQYGTRATELAAALTQGRSQALNSLNYTSLGQGAANAGTNQFNGFINAASGLGTLLNTNTAKSLLGLGTTPSYGLGIGGSSLLDMFS